MPFSLLQDAIEEIFRDVVRILFFNKSVYIGFKPGELCCKVASKFEILNDAVIDALARNQKRNSRRVRR